MTLDELVGKYMRLRAELDVVYAGQPANPDHLNRLGDEIVSTERAIARASPQDEQTSDLLAGIHF